MHMLLVLFTVFENFTSQCMPQRFSYPSNREINKDVNECSNIQIFLFRSNIRICFLNSNIHIFISPSCASSKFSNEEL